MPIKQIFSMQKYLIRSKGLSIKDVRSLGVVQFGHFSDKGGRGRRRTVWSVTNAHTFW